ncbi:efflux RND transporter periplasmic adaptor subunit, partial [Myxococcota bacterium]|nr:efflux RND transporter periplasmic adaptor subunit [Myxococcota bacterium]
QTRTVQTGQFVQPGTVLASMIRRDPMLVRFKVPEDEADPLATGMTVDVRTRGSGKTFRAKITLVSASADEASRMVPITAEISGADAAELKPGSFAEITISHGVPREVPVIPQTAIRPSERGFLAYVVEDGVAKERVLTLGVRAEGGGVEVKSGLEGGETLVIRGSEALRTGAKVRIAGEGKKPDGAGKPGAPAEAGSKGGEGGASGPGERKEKSAP